MIACTFCQGMKGRTAYACPTSREIHIPCNPCHGTGELSPEQAEDYALWKLQGEAMRRLRIADRINQRDAAAAHGIDAPTYSRIEFGLEPAPWLQP